MLLWAVVSMVWGCTADEGSLYRVGEGEGLRRRGRMVVASKGNLKCSGVCGRVTGPKPARLCKIDDG